MWQQMGWLAAAGAFGTLSRFAVNSLAVKYWGQQFPWGTWIVNGSGCFFFGIAWVLAEEKGLLNAQWRGIVLVGFMGAYTTFSTYIFEIGQMSKDGQWMAALLNFSGQNILGLALLMAGMVLARQ